MSSNHRNQGNQGSIGGHQAVPDYSGSSKVPPSNSYSAPTSVQNTDSTTALSSFSSNRAVTALKATSTATGALARLGKAIYSGGGSVLGGGGSNSNNAHRDHTVEFDLSTTNSSVTSATPSPKHSLQTMGSMRDALPSRTLKYKAKSSILAMANSNTINNRFVAIAGQDFFEVLDVSDTRISVSRDMRPAQSNERQFDKVFTVTALQWGFDAYSNHIALSNSGGDILVYDVNHQAARKSGGSSTNTVGGGSLVTQMKESTRVINSLAFSNSSPSTFISGNSDGIVRLWDLRQPRRPVLNFVKNGDNAREVKFRPSDSKKFAAIYDSGVIQRWDIRQPNNTDKRINAHASVGLSIDWHPDLDYLVSGGRDQQIQVWNMSGEYRTPDYVVQTSTAVAKVRWEQPIGKNISVTNSSVISSGRGKGDYKCYVWDLTRPHIPVYALETHDGAVTEIEFCRNKTIRSASRDGHFVQHDLLAEPKVIDNMSSQAVSWLPLVGPTFVLQSKDQRHYHDIRTRNNSMAVEDGGDSILEDVAPPPLSKRKTNTSSSSFVRPRPSTSVSHPSDKLYDLALECYQSICDITLPTSDPESFAYLANNYSVFVDEDSTSSSVFLENAETAAKAFKFRTARIWEIIGQSIAEERKLFEKQLESGLIKIPVSTNNINNNNNIHIKLGDKQSMIHLQVKSRISSNNSRSRSRGPPLKEDVESEGWHDNSNNTEDPSGADNVHLKPNRISREPMEIPVSQTQNPEMAASTSASSHDDIYGKMRDKNGQSYTHLTMASSHSSHASHLHTDYEDEDMDEPRHVGVRLDSFVGSYPSVDNSSHLNHRESASTVLSDDTDMDSDQQSDSDYNVMDMEDQENHGGHDHELQQTQQQHSSETPKDASTRQCLYVKFLETLTHPWRTEVLIKKAVEFAIGRGDVQFCVTIASLCGDIYKNAFPSAKVVEEWTVAYVLLLKKARQFVAAAEIVKYTNIPLIKDMGLTETSFDPMCEFCRSPLRENANSQYIANKSDAGFWYCQSCQKVLSGCILCNSPIKGRAVAFFDCGHRVHADCLKSWLYEENMTECPAGCGNSIVSQL